MKNLLLTLAFITTASVSINAQSADSKFAKNYPVCRMDDQYHICDADAAINESEFGRIETTESLRMFNVYVHMGESTQRGNVRFRSAIKVIYDEPGAVYDGKETLTNDGVMKNIRRNINYLDTANPIPSNDGGLSVR